MLVIPNNTRLIRLRADKSTEFTSSEFRQYCHDIGVSLEFASPNIPQQIGSDERAGRTIAGVVRYLLVDSGLPHFLWGELMQTAVYLSNRFPHAALANETPYQALHGKDGHLGHLRAIGARSFVHVERHTKKLEHRAWNGHLVGYSVDSKSFRVYNSSTRNVLESRNVILIETPSVLPEPGLASGFDEGEVTYNDYDDMVRDVRIYTSKPDLSSPAAADQAVEDLSVRDLLEKNRQTTDRDLDFNPAGSEPSGDLPVTVHRILRLGEKALQGQVGVLTRIVALDVVRVVVLLRVVHVVLVVVLHLVVDVVSLRRSVPLPDQQ